MKLFNFITESERESLSSDMRLENSFNKLVYAYESVDNVMECDIRDAEILVLENDSDLDDFCNFITEATETAQSKKEGILKKMLRIVKELFTKIANKIKKTLKLKPKEVELDSTTIEKVGLLAKIKSKIGVVCNFIKNHKKSASVAAAITTIMSILAFMHRGSKKSSKKVKVDYNKCDEYIEVCEGIVEDVLSLPDVIELPEKEQSRLGSSEKEQLRLGSSKKEQLRLGSKDSGVMLLPGPTVPDDTKKAINLLHDLGTSTDQIVSEISRKMVSGSSPEEVKKAGFEFSKANKYDYFTGSTKNLGPDRVSFGDKYVSKKAKKILGESEEDNDVSADDIYEEMVTEFYEGVSDDDDFNIADDFEF